MTVICIGVGVEYPFARLAARLRADGVPCVEIDMAEPGWRERIAAARQAPERVLLTSQHPFITTVAARILYGVDQDIVSLAEAIRIFDPQRVVYVPHDLAEPFKREELTAAKFIDVALMPPGHFSWLEAHTRVEEVGWIGSMGVDEDLRVPPGAVSFLPSELAVYAADPGRFEATFAPVLSLAPVVKFPVFPGIEALAVTAQRYGCTVLPASTSAMSVIAASRAVISNGLSSVISEAALSGRSTFCVTDGVHPSGAQHETFAASPNVYVADAAEVALRVSEIAGGNGAPAGPALDGILDFDVDRALELILETPVPAGHSARGTQPSEERRSTHGS